MNTNDVKNSDIQNTESTEKVSTDVKKDVKETTTVTTTNEVEKRMRMHYL